MKSTVVARTATVAVALPLLTALVIFLPHFHHAVINLLALPVTLMGALETENLCRLRGGSPPRLLFAALGATLPGVAFLEIAGLVGPAFFPLWLTALVSAALLRAVAAGGPQSFPELLPSTASALLVLVYPGLFVAYLVRLSGLEQATRVLLLFFALVLVNDILAYVAGMALGRFTRVRVAVSPSKSGAGFVGGWLGSVGVAWLFYGLVPGLFGGSLGRALLIGGLIGLLTIVGDLLESGLKRSAGAKDSGTIIPGRGGVLDSIDSWLLSAVALYYLLV